MPAMTPADICRLFRQSMAEGDLDAVLSLYDADAVFVNQAGEVTKGRDGLGQELAPFAAAKTTRARSLVTLRWRLRTAADDG